MVPKSAAPGCSTRWKRPEPGAGRRGPQRWLPASVLFMLLLLPQASAQRAFCSTGMCCLNPKSGQACSKDRTINFYGPDGKLPVSSKMPAGQCEGGKCVCVDGYSTGGACELLTRANSMARPVMGELDNSVIDGGVNDSLPVLSWRYLAKTCWGSRVDGNLKLELQFVADECLIRDCTVPGQGVDYSTRLLPDVLFYASYDKEFSLAAIAAESDVGTDGRAQLDEICKGTGAIFRERMVCKGLTNGTLASRCVMEKTYNVMNRGDTDTLVYLVVANCGLSGRVRWSVETSVKHPPSMYHGVCGARGTSLSQRCFSDAGGGCHVQEPALLKKREEWRTEGKISRAQIAMFAVIFSGSLVVGLGMIKYGQLRHKRQKQRQLLMRTRMGPTMPPAVSSGRSDDPDPDSFQTNGDSVQAHHLVVTSQGR